MGLFPRSIDSPSFSHALHRALKVKVQRCLRASGKNCPQLPGFNGMAAIDAKTSQTYHEASTRGVFEVFERLTAGIKKDHNSVTAMSKRLFPLVQSGEMS